MMVRKRRFNFESRSTSANLCQYEGCKAVALKAYCKAHGIVGKRAKWDKKQNTVKALLNLSKQAGQGEEGKEGKDIELVLSAIKALRTEDTWTYLSKNSELSNNVDVLCAAIETQSAELVSMILLNSQDAKALANKAMNCAIQNSHGDRLLCLRRIVYAGATNWWKCEAFKKLCGYKDERVKPVVVCLLECKVVNVDEVLEVVCEEVPCFIAVECVMAKFPEVILNLESLSILEQAFDTGRIDFLQRIKNQSEGHANLVDRFLTAATDSISQRVATATIQPNVLRFVFECVSESDFPAPLLDRWIIIASQRTDDSALEILKTILEFATKIKYKFKLNFDSMLSSAGRVEHAQWLIHNNLVKINFNRLYYLTDAKNMQVLELALQEFHQQDSSHETWLCLLMNLLLTHPRERVVECFAMCAPMSALRILGRPGLLPSFIVKTVQQAIPMVADEADAIDIVKQLQTCYEARGLNF